jgi:hypothetical protein
VRRRSWIYKGCFESAIRGRLAEPRHSVHSTPMGSRHRSPEEFRVTCPYCGERIDIYLEPEITGALVLDCEVCCQPWQLHVSSDGPGRQVDVTRADGSE